VVIFTYKYKYAKIQLLLSIHEFEKIKNTEMKKRKTNVIWTESE
jgi:hypothetical protein